jgi:hypothetical protein
MALTPIGILLFWFVAYGIAYIIRLYVRKFDNVSFLVIMLLVVVIESFAIALLAALFAG